MIAESIPLTVLVMAVVEDSNVAVKDFMLVMTKLAMAVT